jgi:Ca2+-binding EF-hand superfamily protein
MSRSVASKAAGPGFAGRRRRTEGLGTPRKFNGFEPIPLENDPVTHHRLLLAAALVASPAIATAAPPVASNAKAAPQSLTKASLVSNLDAMFKAVDTNHDGAVNQSEIAAAEAREIQQRVAALRARVDAEFTKLDTNKDGQLSKAEFVAMTPQAPETPNGAQALAKLDKNKDGKLSPDEFKSPHLTAFDKLDTNHDGTISESERQAAEAAARKR